jgi:hypothetical protein
MLTHSSFPNNQSRVQCGCKQRRVPTHRGNQKERCLCTVRGTRFSLKKSSAKHDQRKHLLGLVWSLAWFRPIHNNASSFRRSLAFTRESTGRAAAIRSWSARNAAKIGARSALVHLREGSAYHAVIPLASSQHLTAAFCTPTWYTECCRHTAHARTHARTWFVLIPGMRWRRQELCTHVPTPRRPSTALPGRYPFSR